MPKLFRTMKRGCFSLSQFHNIVLIRYDVRSFTKARQWSLSLTMWPLLPVHQRRSIWRHPLNRCRASFFLWFPQSPWKMWVNHRQGRQGATFWSHNTPICLPPSATRKEMKFPWSRHRQMDRSVVFWRLIPQRFIEVWISQDTLLVHRWFRPWSPHFNQWFSKKARAEFFYQGRY